MSDPFMREGMPAREQEYKITKTSTGWGLKRPYLKSGHLILAPSRDAEEIPERVTKILGTHTIAF